MSPNPLLTGLRPTHPGEILREDIFPALGRPKAEIARLLGISRRTLYDILEQKSPITPQMALRITRLIGGDPEHWLRMQATYELRVTEKTLASELAKIPRIEAPEAA